MPSNSRGDAVWSIPDLQTNHGRRITSSQARSVIIVIIVILVIIIVIIISNNSSNSNNNFQLAYAAGFLMISLPLMNVNETRRRKKHEKNSKKDTETWGEFMSHYWDG